MGEGLQKRGKYGIIQHEGNSRSHSPRACDQTEEGIDNGRTLGIGRAFAFFVLLLTVILLFGSIPAVAMDESVAEDAVLLSSTTNLQPIANGRYFVQNNGSSLFLEGGGTSG